MIYSQKQSKARRNLSLLEKSKLKKLRQNRPTAWMIDAIRR